MGARQSSFARSGAQDDGERESGGPASPASYTIEPIPQGLEHVVYPKYEEAFRLGLAAFSHPMRTNKFKRELPPILGSIEFQNHPNGGITPLPASDTDTPHTQKTASAVASTQEILSSNLRIAAYGSNGEFHPTPDASQELGPAGWGDVADEEKVEQKSASARAKARLTPVFSVDTVKSEKASRSTGIAHTRSTSRADSTLWHSASSGGLPDSPTPSSINMEPSRFTIPIQEQNDRLYTPLGSKSDGSSRRGGKSNAVDTSMIKKTRSFDLVNAPTSSTSAPGGYGENRKESPLLEALSLSFANGGLFDTDEDFSFEISKLRNAASQSVDVQLVGDAIGRDVGVGTSGCSQQVKACSSQENVSDVRLGSSNDGSRKEADDLQLLENVYEEIRQWQYGRDSKGDPGL
ncbi:hypothetical protein BSKO_13093 [Bryopsis sp. KO-2023]|nr:hypothetical protein BSKO_13093 [Bryopsis sp. KO-2023]